MKTPPPPLRWPAEALWQSLEPLLPGLTVEVLPRIDSSNSELARRARAGDLAPTLLVAEAQTAGRGRLGRAWHGAPGAALTFSLGLPLAPADWGGLSLAVGVALAESLHPAIALKWPNDLWWLGRKLAGVLIETVGVGADGGHPSDAARHVIVGVGLNIEPPQTTDLRTPAAGLRELEPTLDAPAALARVALPLVQALLAFQAQGFAPFATRYAARDLLAGQRVSLSDGREGIADGVDAHGALRLLEPGGVHTVISGEVSVRPA